MAWDYEVIYTNSIGAGFSRQFHTLAAVEVFVSGLERPATVKAFGKVAGQVESEPYDTVIWLDTPAPEQADGVTEADDDVPFGEHADLWQKIFDLRADLEAEREAHAETQSDLKAGKQYAEKLFAGICKALHISPDSKMPEIFDAIEAAR